MKIKIQLVLDRYRHEIKRQIGQLLVTNTQHIQDTYK
jgi:hypothetical protein